MRLLCINIPDGPDDDPDGDLPQLVIGNVYIAVDRKSSEWITARLIALQRKFKTPHGLYYQLLGIPGGWYHESYFGHLDSGIEEQELELIHSHEHAQGHAPAGGKRSGF